MSCPICQHTLKPIFTALVLGKHQAQFEYCDSCGFMKVQRPHWLEEAYTSAIASTDTGLVMRNTTIATKLCAVLRLVLGDDGHSRYLDAAGGYGMLTRLMRDYGFDFFWSDKYCDNLMARGFEYRPELGPCRAVTAFEIMEHLEDPRQFVTEALAQTQADTFIFTTELFAGSPPALKDWWYYSLETGQHIAFYQQRTLAALAEQLGMRFFTGGGLHVFTKKNISPALLRLCASRVSNLLAPWTKGVSRTIPDHETMVRRLRDGDKIA